MKNIFHQITNRETLVYPENITVVNKNNSTASYTNAQVLSTYFPEDISDVIPESQFDKVEIGEGNYIFNGDNIEVLRTLPDNSIDSCVTDPPYGLQFLGKQWDYDVPSVELWKECYRILKPGGYLLSFGSSRTYHRMAVKVEDAGFEIRDQIMWVYGTGFPKSNNIGKAVDKLLGNTREIVGKKENKINFKSKKGSDKSFYDSAWHSNNYIDLPITMGNSKWEGWGTALKPSHEPIVMARKPFNGSVAKNIIKWNTGAINIDDCRIEFEETKNPATNPLYRQENDYKMPKKGEESKGVVSFTSSKNKISSLGRYPANIIFDEKAGEILDEQSGITPQGHWSKTTNTGFGKFGNGKTIYSGIGEKDKVKAGASRFFYCPKPSKKEREEGLTNESVVIEERDKGQDNRNVPQKSRSTKRRNTHSTVKPVKLIQYLIRLVTPIGGTTIDPFFGSGTSGKSALIEDNDYKFIGIEKEKEYFDIAVERCQYEFDKSKKTAA